MENTVTNESQVNQVSQIRKKSYLNDFEALATAANENAVNKGFWNEERPLSRGVALIIGEAYEAYDAYRAAFISPDLQEYYKHREFVAAFNSSGLPDPGKDFANAPDEIKAKAVKEAYEKFIKGCVAEELGDVVIRLGDTAKGYQLDFNLIDNGAATFEKEMLNEPLNKYGEVSIDELILDLNYKLLAIHVNAGTRLNSLHLGESLRLVYFIAERLNIDLDKHIDLKAEYNSGRAYKHGKTF